MRGTPANVQIGIFIASFSTALSGQVSQQVRASIDRIVGGQGATVRTAKSTRWVFQGLKQRLSTIIKSSRQILG